MLLGRGSKHRWQGKTAKKPADIIKRLRARHHSQRSNSQRRLLDDHACQCAKPAERQGKPTKKQNR
jgi:predicted HD phosphohydrolase